MATTLGTLLLLIKGDTKDLKSKLTEADKSILSFAKNMTRMGSQLRSTGKQLTAELTLPLVGLAVAALKTAGSLEEFKAPLDEMRGSLRGAMAGILRGALPALQGLAKAVSGMAKWFTDLGDGAKKTVLVLAGMAAALGPALVIAGRLVTTIATLQRAFVAARIASLAFNATMLSNPIMLVVAAVALLAAGLVILVQKQREVKKEMSDILALSKEQAELDRAAGRRVLTTKIAEYTDKLAAANAELERAKKLGQFEGGAISRANQEINRVKAVLNELGAAVAKYDQETGKLSATQGGLTENQKIYQEALEKLKREFAQIDQQAAIYGEELDAQAEKKRTLKSVIDDLISKGFTAQGTAIQGIIRLYGELLRVETEQVGATESQIEALGKFAAKVDPLAKASAARSAFYKAEWKDEEALVEETQTLTDKLQQYGSIASSVFGGIADIVALSFQNQTAALQNEETARRTAIMSSLSDETTRAKALEELDTEFEGRRKELAREQALRSRNASVFQSLLDTANAVVSALATVKPTVPLGIIAAALVGGIGLAKTALIAATPLPALAEGGSFIVPPGFPNDSFPVRVESGEEVNVTPADQVGRQAAPAFPQRMSLRIGSREFDAFVEDEIANGRIVLRGQGRR